MYFVVTMPDAAAPSEPRNLALDGARGLAIVLILACHGLNVPTPPSHVLDTIKTLNTFTFGGVELFFVLSGFLIGTGLLRSRRALNQPRVFYARRACRILPVYALLLASFFLARESSTLNRGIGGAYFQNTVPLWSYFVFVQNIVMGALHHIGPWWLAVTWSLAVEEQFYAVAPWLVRRASDDALVVFALLAVIACPLIRMSLALDMSSAIYFTVARIDSLLVGLAIAVVWETPAWRARAIALRRPLGWCTAVFVTAFFVGPFTALNRQSTIAGLLPTLLGIGFAGLLLWILAAPENLLARMLRMRFWVFMGGISYFLYLFHFPALYTSHGFLRHAAPELLDWGGLGGSVLAFAVVIVAAMASRRWIELPLISFGHRFRYRYS